MIIRRPMRGRQIEGAMFGETAVLVMRNESRNKHGEAMVSESTDSIKVATNPLSPKDPRIASLQEGGIRIEDTREFFSIVPIPTSPPSYIRYDANDGLGVQTYIVHSTARYGHYSSSIFYRREVQ